MLHLTLSFFAYLIAAAVLCSVALIFARRAQYSARLKKSDAFIAQLDSQSAAFEILRRK